MDKINLKQHMKDLPKPSVNDDSVSNSQYDIDDIWKIVSENIRLSMGFRDYSAWVDGVYLNKIENGIAVFSCPEQFKKDRI